MQGELRDRQTCLVGYAEPQPKVHLYERLLKAAHSDITVERARELVKTMYALTYTKPGYTLPTKVMLGMDDEQAELYRLVEEWVKRDLGNA